MKKKKLKNLLHRKSKASYQEKSEKLMKRKPMFQTQDQIFEKYDYWSNVDSDGLNHYYEKLVQPVVDKIKKEPFNYNPKDNRTLLNQLNYYTTNDYKFFTGVVLGQKAVINKNQVNIYLLVGSVYALVKDSRGATSYRSCTDHLWLDINEFDAVFSDNQSQITIGMGDIIHFYAKLSQYRGYRENIRQTKFGVKDVVIQHSGYPQIIANKQNNGSRIYLHGDIPYLHHEHYLVKYYNPNLYPTSFTSFGDQIDDLVKKTIDDPKYQYSKDGIMLIRPIIESAMNYTTPHRLILNSEDAKLFWIPQSQAIPDKYEIIGDSNTLQDMGVEKYYRQLVDKYKWRYEAYTYIPEK